MAVGKCPTCGGKLDIPRKHAGKQICCAHCQNIFIAPAVSSEAQDSVRSNELASAVGALPLPSALNDANPPTSSDSANPDTSAWPPGTAAPNPVSSQATSNPASPIPHATPAAKPKRTAKQKSKPKPGQIPLPAAMTASAETVQQQSPAQSGIANSAAQSAATQPTSAQAAPAQQPQKRTVKIRQPTTEQRSSDGKLPTLSLTEKPKRKQIEMPAWKSNPIFLAVLFCISMILSAAILLVDVEPPEQRRKTNAEARIQLREFYEVASGMDIKPYQEQLRLAQLAHSRGDRRAEQYHYRKVMNYLRAEDRDPHIGLTGSLERDAELESYLAGLLSELD